MNIKRATVVGLTAGALVAGGATLAGPASADTATQTSPSGPYWPVLQRGQTNEQVRTVQWLLNCKNIKVDVPSHFGPKTQAAVKTYQSRYGLSPDGKVGAYTWTSMASRAQVKYSDRNDCVKALQVALNVYRDMTGAKDLPITGYFGPKTRTSLHKFQTTYGLPVQDVVTVATWNRLTGPESPGE
ncbi:peptidoglycan-binding domain-containing protein [Actinomadura rudentiformis]|uniref:Peptidoglycan-binding protein n=1 Tax=Actinomadura rudentiformis TaxID=359158 RepID=A0A6H9Z0H9_9ACTN|nr:peptidoglycan-binding protein [Actinomadura rudentiformis]KAB2350215.1 peptidoglycan-binding protein [Actinomadura rudentiformis]